MKFWMHVLLIAIFLPNSFSLAANSCALVLEKRNTNELQIPFDPSYFLSLGNQPNIRLERRKQIADFFKIENNYSNESSLNQLIEFLTAHNFDFSPSSLDKLMVGFLDLALALNTVSKEGPAPFDFIELIPVYIGIPYPEGTRTSAIHLIKWIGENVVQPNASSASSRTIRFNAVLSLYNSALRAHWRVRDLPQIFNDESHYLTPGERSLSLVTYFIELKSREIERKRKETQQ